MRTSGEFGRENAIEVLKKPELQEGRSGLQAAAVARRVFDADDIWIAPKQM
jgi:hypothetical protein